jgi:hypothetical protein
MLRIYILSTRVYRSPGFNNTAGLHDVMNHGGLGVGSRVCVCVCVCGGWRRFVWRRKWGAFRRGGAFRTAELRQWGRAVRLLSSRAEIITYFQARRCSGFNPSSRLMDNFHQSSPRQSLNDPPRTDQSRSGLSNRVGGSFVTRSNDSFSGTPCFLAECSIRPRCDSPRCCGRAFLCGFFQGR